MVTKKPFFYQKKIERAIPAISKPIRLPSSAGSLWNHPVHQYPRSKITTKIKGDHTIEKSKLLYATQKEGNREKVGNLILGSSVEPQRIGYVAGRRGVGQIDGPSPSECLALVVHARARVEGPKPPITCTLERRFDADLTVVAAAAAGDISI